MIAFIYKHTFACLLLWVLFIFVLCATPGQYIPSANWLELLSFDKFVHATLFFVLTVLGFIICLKSDKTNGALFVFFLLAISYGVFLEIMQAHYFSNRSSDWKDMAANTFGCCLAWLVLRKMREQHLKLQSLEEK